MQWWHFCISIERSRPRNRYDSVLVYPRRRSSWNRNILFTHEDETLRCRSVLASAKSVSGPAKFFPVQGRDSKARAARKQRHVYVLSAELLSDEHTQGAVASDPLVVSNRDIEVKEKNLAAKLKSRGNEGVRLQRVLQQLSEIFRTSQSCSLFKAAISTSCDTFSEDLYTEENTSERCRCMSWLQHGAEGSKPGTSDSTLLTAN
jgi:hypothetical protein